jgi:hypothetical protein
MLVDWRAERAARVELQVAADAFGNGPIDEDQAAIDRARDRLRRERGHA